MTMCATLISPSGVVLHHRARCSTTPAEQGEAKAVRVRSREACRLEENRLILKHRNVRAFLRALGASLNPTLGAGMPAPSDAQELSDLPLVEVLRGLGVVELIQIGDVWSTLQLARARWPALPAAPGADGHYAPPAPAFTDFCAIYKSYGGTLDEMGGALAFGRRLPAP